MKRTLHTNCHLVELDMKTEAKIVYIIQCEAVQMKLFPFQHKDHESNQVPRKVQKKRAVILQ